MSTSPGQPALNPTQRFSNRVENYIRYRPHYPPDLIAWMEAELGLTRESVIADIGSGTGISSEMFLVHGNPVFAVEPNREMRQAAEKLLSHHAGFHSIGGRAEVTTLPDGSADFIVVMQAFHWFNRDLCRREFARILKPGGWVVLVWNERCIDASEFSRGYEDLLLTYAQEYRQVKHENVDEAALRAFFGPAGFRTHRLPNHQVFGFESLKGRLLSSSYAPLEGQPNHRDILIGLRSLFVKYQEQERVRFDYVTSIYAGRL